MNVCLQLRKRLGGGWESMGLKEYPPPPPPPLTHGISGHQYLIMSLFYLFSSLPCRLDENFRLLERTCRMNRDTHKDLEEKLIRMERTKNCIDTELNSLKPEIKQMQAERGKLYR